MHITEKCEAILYTKNDLIKVICNGPDMFNSEDEWEKEIETLQGVIYSMEENLSGHIKYC